MDRWKSRAGKGQRGEEKREEIREEKEWEGACYGAISTLMRKSEKEEEARAPKGWEVARFSVFFPMICGSGGRKVGSKRRAWSHLVRWEMKKCTPLWREAHFCKKMIVWTTFGSSDVECAPCPKWANRECLWQFQLQPPLTTLHSTTPDYPHLQLQQLLQQQLQLQYPTHYTTLNYTTLH